MLGGKPAALGSVESGYGRVVFRDAGYERKRCALGEPDARAVGSVSACTHVNPVSYCRPCREENEDEGEKTYGVRPKLSTQSLSIGIGYTHPNLLTFNVLSSSGRSIDVLLGNSIDTFRHASLLL